MREIGVCIFRWWIIINTLFVRETAVKSYCLYLQSTSNPICSTGRAGTTDVNWTGFVSISYNLRLISRLSTRNIAHAINNKCMRTIRRVVGFRLSTIVPTLKSIKIHLFPSNSDESECANVEYSVHWHCVVYDARHSSDRYNVKERFDRIDQRSRLIDRDSTEETNVQSLTPFP